MPATLEDSVSWDAFEFHVIDVDGLPQGCVFEQHQLLDGYGETFWVKDGRIVASMGRDWANDSFDENTSNILQA
jgi:hypothetical protein